MKNFTILTYGYSKLDARGFPFENAMPDAKKYCEANDIWEAAKNLPHNCLMVTQIMEFVPPIKLLVARKDANEMMLSVTVIYEQNALYAHDPRMN